MVISHRLSMTIDSDRVFVLEGGRIVEEDHHNQLIAAGGTYASLFATQAAPYSMSESSCRPTIADA